MCYCINYFTSIMHYEVFASSDACDAIAVLSAPSRIILKKLDLYFTIFPLIVIYHGANVYVFFLPCKCPAIERICIYLFLRFTALLAKCRREHLIDCDEQKSK